MTQPLLDIDNLSIAFRQQGETTSVVSELSLQIAVGETLALVVAAGQLSHRRYPLSRSVAAARG